MTSASECSSDLVTCSVEIVEASSKVNPPTEIYTGEESSL
jgi:hypothetical protein